MKDDYMSELKRLNFFQQACLEEDNYLNEFNENQKFHLKRDVQFKKPKKLKSIDENLT